MRVHPNKKAIRALGVSESFQKPSKFSALAGVVMRSDLVVDGFALGQATVGGDDATASLVRLNKSLRRADVNIIILSGAVISHYNIVDVDALSARTTKPVVCLTYRESAGIEDSIRTNFAEPEAKLALYRRLGPRVPIALRTGFRVYARLAGISLKDAGSILDSFTLQGGIPEPVRVAKLLARAAYHFYAK